MERFIMQDLIAWKNREDRKPLILLGARQVGKTYILKEFGQREFENVAYINCDNNAMVKDLFATDYNIERILLTIGAITGVNIQAGKTLIIMDEIQELHRGLASLKYFCEEAREYHVAVAGSLLGLTLHQGESYPVGKVNTLEMFPMTYEEFLLARGFKQRVDLLQSGMWDVVNSLRTLYIQHLREYYLVGGMPEAVKKFIDTNDANAVREVQKEILHAYEKDISKHAPDEQVVRINQVWNSIPSQLAKENKKFIYGVVKQGARAKDYELAIQWLIDAGLIYKISRVKTIGMPLKIHEDISAFKLYLLDCGLLGAMSNTPPALLLLPNNDNSGKGDFTENFICCQLESLRNIPIYYYSKENSQLEIDFVIQIDTNIIPLEVKAEENLQAKSLKVILANNPGMYGLRFSMSDYREQENITNVPLYGARGYLVNVLNNAIRC
ncbi:MAG: ATP-binding protein [Prevotella sp.]|mgnify:FL=1|nr:ATP-binding protein [Prevotella sp.]MDY4151101.1 ATP-binding protein [Prevotella sp.]